MSACRRHYPGRSDGTDSLMTAPSSSAFPTLQLGRLLHYQFRGLLSVHSRYNLQTVKVKTGPCFAWEEVDTSSPSWELWGYRTRRARLPASTYFASPT